MDSDLIFDMIDAISVVSSKKAKMNMLIPELKPYFLYAYDPFKTYGIRKATFNGQANGRKFDDKIWNLFDHLAKRTITGKKAQDFINRLSLVLSYKSSILFHRILTKDLRCGVSTKSINEVWPGLIAEGITMQPVEYESRFAVFPCYASVKLRGNRGYYRWSDNTIYSRKGKPYIGLDHICTELYTFGHDYDGELLVPGIPFEDSSGIVRSHAQTPEVYFCLFDAPATTIKYKDRRASYNGLKNLTSDFIRPCSDMPIQSEEQLFQARNLAFKAGHEGLVIKDPNSFYELGYSNKWLKLKELLDNIDLEVIDVYEGKGKYVGRLGGVIVNYNGVPVRVGGGYSDSERTLYYDQPNLIVGRTIEVKAQERTKHGSLRNPNYVRIREK